MSLDGSCDATVSVYDDERSEAMEMLPMYLLRCLVHQYHLKGTHVVTMLVSNTSSTEATGVCPIHLLRIVVNMLALVSSQAQHVTIIAQKLQKHFQHANLGRSNH